MHIANSLWSAVTYLTGWLTLSPSFDNNQQPLPIDLDMVAGGDYASTSYPSFPPPGRRQRYAGSDFICEYPDMPEWTDCSSSSDRSCWLMHPDGRRYDSHTDYEIDAPVGVERYYELEITEGTWNADGLVATDAKLVNNQYPGPWIQACWGDRIIVNVTNKMQFNGTAIHWHGIRQNVTTHMDGVPGITQCPIAPNDYFVYNFSAVQYGSSWYHSHYSVQYADGVLGPITIHGPQTAYYDEAKPPLLMSDWFHKSAFKAIHNDPKTNAPLKKTLGKPTLLLNGTGDVRNFGYENDTEIPPKYTLHFEPERVKPVGRAKRYLLRLINTSFDSAFLFSIDNHKLQIVSADFVPIEPYTRSHVIIGIGQRYNVIVEAEPKQNDGARTPTDGNFWIRSTAIRCFVDPIVGNNSYDRIGILRYSSNENEPRSEPWFDLPGYATGNIPCRDEYTSDLVPRLPWNVSKIPANGKPIGEEFEVKLNFRNGGTPIFPLGRMSFQPEKNSAGWTPLQINYSEPIFLQLDKTGNTWPASWVVVPEDYTENDWVYLALTGFNNSPAGAHPIHLHGHDFAILQQEEKKVLAPENIHLNYHNPARRDVVLLPDNGFVIIAFKADNPGNWIMHCHIAFHASWGLALQILERQEDANRIWPNPGDPAISEANRVCSNWKKWHSKCENHWPGYDAKLDCFPACEINNCTEKWKGHVFQDDSGI